MDEVQPVALRASARHVSIAAVDSRLVSSRVGTSSVDWGGFLHPITDRRKLLAFDRFVPAPEMARD
jgi:hypothetical protein